MEDQKPSPEPIQPVRTPVVPPRPAFPWGIVVPVIVAAAVLSVGITLFLVKGSFVPFLSQIKNTPSSVKKSQTTVPTDIPVIPTGTTCDVSDNAFCIMLADLKSAISSKNYAGFLTYHNRQSVICDPDGMFVAICEEAAKGVVKQGYGLGYNESEGTVATKESYVTSVSAYVKTNGPFSYQGSLVSGDKGIAVFLNPGKDHIIAFPVKRSGSTWRMDHLLLGGTFENEAFTTLSNSLLDLVP